MSECRVTSMTFEAGRAERRLIGGNSANTDNRGQYTIKAPQGRYYLMAQCEQTLPAPHPLMYIGPDTVLPHLRYGVQFYPGMPDSAGAGRLAVTAGADLRGIDFQMHLTSTVALRGRFGGDLEALRHHPWVHLAPRDPLLTHTYQYGGRIDAARSTFWIDTVPPGHYTLFAMANDDPRGGYYAEMPVDIGTGPPGPIEIDFPSPSNFTGSVEFASDPTGEGAGVIRPGTQGAGLMIRLVPLDWPAYSSPYAKVEQDGRFELSGVPPGRWRLQLEGMQGYAKSFTIGDRAASPHGFSTGPGVSGTMRIVMSVQYAEVEGTVSAGKPEGAGQLWVMIVPDDADTIIAGGVTTMSVDSSGHFSLNHIEPGKYHVFAFTGVEPWAIQQNAAVFKALTDRGVELNLEAGAHATAQPDIIPTDEILRLLEEQE